MSDYVKAVVQYIQLHLNKTDRWYQNSVVVQAMGQYRPIPFTQREVDMVCTITVQLCPNMIMGYAIEILDAGLAEAYINSSDTRLLINAWALSEGYAGMSLLEFMKDAQADQT